MAKDMQAQGTESTKSTSNKYFLNVYATLSNGKRVKITVATLDYNLTHNKGKSLEWIKDLIAFTENKGAPTEVSGLSAQFVIAGSDADDDEEDAEFTTSFS